MITRVRPTRSVRGRRGRSLLAVAFASAAGALGILASAPVALGAQSDVTPFPVVPPSVSAEIPATDGSVPFAAHDFDPQFPLPDGYGVREFFVSGEASIYEFTPTGIRVVAPCPAVVTGTQLPACSGLPYTTRMLILAPRKPRRFSGNVWINPLNPSAGYDYPVVWDRQALYHARKGDIFVEWSSKSVAVDALNRIDPVRYAPLRWPHNPTAPTALSDAPYDGITFDVAAQLAALFQENAASSPIHRYRVKRVFEAGFSQDGGFTFTQANVFHRLARLPNGAPVYDGYLSQGARGTGDINFGLTPDGELPAGDPRITMQPRDVPVIKLNTETELTGFSSSPGVAVDWRRPDSDAANDRYREWEVGGASHDDAMSLWDPTNQTLYGVPTFPSDCEHAVPPNVSPTDFPYAYVANAASEALVDWVHHGRPPARLPRLAQTNLAEPSKESLLRDRFGNALGGVRTPHLDVPHSTYNVIDGGPGFCWSIGWRTPLAQPILDSLYDSHADYVQRFRASAHKAVKRGIWLAADARAAISTARDAGVP